MDMGGKLMRIYNLLLRKHGYQGWWPIGGEYHPRDYSFPRNSKDIFEICAGAILTQNTSWKNVEKVLKILHEKNLMSPRAMLKLKREELALLIRSSGYHNQKTRKLQEFAGFFLGQEGIPSREDLLSIWGIGKETADSILLYGYKKPYFVIDTYTKRLFKGLMGWEFKDYDGWQECFHNHLQEDYKLFNEFHALIVAEGKIMKDGG